MNPQELKILMYLRYRSSPTHGARIPDASRAILDGLQDRGYLKGQPLRHRGTGWMITGKGKTFVDNKLNKES